MGKGIPYRCPVCDGKGIVPGGFYRSTGDNWSSNSSTDVCKACGGSGIIWSDCVTNAVVQDQQTNYKTGGEY